MTEDNTVLGYLLDEMAWLQLVAIKTRLYNDRVLTGDQRRDLANAMDAIMHTAMTITEEEMMP